MGSECKNVANGSLKISLERILVDPFLRVKTCHLSGIYDLKVQVIQHCLGHFVMYLIEMPFLMFQRRSLLECPHNNIRFVSSCRTHTIHILCIYIYIYIPSYLAARTCICILILAQSLYWKILSCRGKEEATVFCLANEENHLVAVNLPMAFVSNKTLELINRKLKYSKTARVIQSRSKLSS